MFRQQLSLLGEKSGLIHQVLVGLMAGMAASDCICYDAVRIGIANVLELIFHLSHCSMITELQL